MVRLTARTLLLSSTRSLEFQNAWASFLVGCLLLHPASTFGTAVGYRWFAEWAPEWVWGALFLALGAGQLVAVVTDAVPARRITAGLTAVLFAVYAAGIAVSNPLSVAVPFVVPLAIGQAWAFVQARRMA